jgi:pimeloyl-ACP methyl ester carboxylesterase
MLPVTDLLIRGNLNRGSSQRDSEPVPAIVLLHFFGSSRREYIETGVMLANSFRVVSIDTPGFGEASDCTEFSVEAMAEQFESTLASLKLNRFMLVGHSMTGKVAAVLASRKLPGLEKLVLLAPSPVCPEPIAPADRATMLAQAEPTRADAEHYIRDNSNLPIKPEVFERAVEDRLRTNPNAWRAWLEHGSEEDWAGRVGTLSLPTLVIAAEKDKSLSPDVQRKLTLPHFSNGSLEIVRDSGHIVPMEAPERLATLLKNFAEA